MEKTTYTFEDVAGEKKDTLLHILGKNGLLKVSGEYLEEQTYSIRPRSKKALGWFVYGEGGEILLTQLGFEHCGIIWGYELLGAN